MISHDWVTYAVRGKGSWSHPSHMSASVWGGWFLKVILLSLEEWKSNS